MARGMSPMRQRFSNLTRRISGVSAGGGSGGSGGGGGRLVLGDPMFRALYESLLKLEVFVTSLKDRCVAAWGYMPGFVCCMFCESVCECVCVCVRVCAL